MKQYHVNNIIKQYTILEYAKNIFMLLRIFLFFDKNSQNKDFTLLID